MLQNIVQQVHCFSFIVWSSWVSRSCAKNVPRTARNFSFGITIGSSYQCFGFKQVLCSAYR